MREHIAILVLGESNEAHTHGHFTVDWSDIRETCYGCVIEGPENAKPGPCRKTPTTAAHLTTGALVQTVPGPRWRTVPASSAVVIGAIGTGDNVMALVWFWSLGLPEFGTSVHPVTPDEVTPLQTTLATLPALALRTISRRFAACEGAAARLLAPLAEPLKAAAH